MKNRIITIFTLIFLMFTPITSSACCSWLNPVHDAKSLAKDVKNLGEKAYHSLSDAGKGLEQAAKDGIHTIKDLPGNLKKYVLKELKKLEKEMEKAIVHAIEKDDVHISNQSHSLKRINSNRFANIIVDVDNKADIKALGAISSSFRIGIKWVHKTFHGIDLGDKSGATWVNSVSVPSSSRYDIILNSDLSGELIFLGGHNYVSSIVEGKFYKDDLK